MKLEVMEFEKANTIKKRTNNIILTVSHSGRNPITDGNEAKIIEHRASATFCLTYKNQG